VFLPLGGAGEIGMNLNLYGYGPPEGRQWLMLDCGVSFGDGDILGIDAIMPDPEFIVQHAHSLAGIVLTHAHEDHIGAIPHIWPRLRCPIYATPFTAILLRRKLDEFGLLDEVTIHILPVSKKISVGIFAIELLTITHSIPESFAVVIHTPLGIVLHTGDWKLDPAPLVGKTTDILGLKALGDLGVLALVGDSTNVLVRGRAGSESDVLANLQEIVLKLDGRVAITSFASNVARLESVFKIAKLSGRKLVVVGRSMRNMLSAAREAGILVDLPQLLDESDGANLRRSEALYLCTGSQGQATSALDRISRGEHRFIALESGDAVIFSSRVIPGNFEPIAATQNRLAERGIILITADDHFVHVSGHPCRDELADMYHWVNPRIAIPVHGEKRHLVEHAKFAESLQVPRAIVPSNGSIIRLAPGEPEIVARVRSGRTYVDGRLIMLDSDKSYLARETMATAGIVAATIFVGHSGDICTEPSIVMLGVPVLVEAAISEAIRQKIRDVAKMPVRKSDAATLEDDIREIVLHSSKIAWGKEPLVRVSVNYF
jgi:ribonuclease J